MANLLSKIFCVIIFFFSVKPGISCSTVCLNDGKQIMVGKNYDWQVEDGLVIINKRNVIKTALPSTDGTPPAQWISKFGSITFNQYGRELPMGGINEAGLVVESMWLNETQYPTMDERSGICNLQWIQYQLDNAATITEVIESDKELRIFSDNPSKIHYLICDHTGQCATVEIIEGKMVYHTGEQLLVPALTNSTYQESLSQLQCHQGFGGDLPIPEGIGSIERFIRAAHFIKNNNTTSIKAMDRILKSLAQGKYTKWSIIYDICNRKVHFRTLTHNQMKSVDLTSLDFTCESPVKVLEINFDQNGSVSNHFIQYSTELNSLLINNTFSKTTFLQNIPPEIKRALIEYPETTECQY